MAIVFRNVRRAPLRGFDATAPEGAVLGIIGEEGSGKGALLRAAVEDAERPQPRRLLGPGDALDFRPAAVLAMEHTLARHDAVQRAQAAVEIDKLRRAGTTILLVSHEEALLRDLADEVWWLQGGKLAGRGDPEEMLRAYSKRVAQRLRETAGAAQMSPRWRRGDGRARIEKLELIGEMGSSTSVLRSGELAVTRLTLQFRDAVADPVVGLMIRSRAGMNVYGTNTELEGLKLGPRAAGDRIELTFAFRCELCNGEYTLTAASHDPDGVWHDWLEDAVAFMVADDRYTAGVANLRARAEVRVVG